jgi:hypothetical protein
MSQPSNPQFPIYIVSKGRADSRLTMRHLDQMRVPYHVVIEAHELDAYAAVIDRARLLILDPQYQRDYDTCDELADSKSKGPGPARNFAWAHAIERGAAWHWVMDDNIRGFARLNQNRKHRVSDGTIFRCMEDFVLRYANVTMAGPNYEKFAKRLQSIPPFITNTRIYSCNLIRNDVPFRWRGRYNEDTDLSLMMLKAGYCTIQFNAFLQFKVMTQTVRGGNTAEFYAKEGTLPKSKMLVNMHPDCAQLVWKFGRCHHQVDYARFKQPLVRRADVSIATGVDNYGMRLTSVTATHTDPAQTAARQSRQA